MKKMEYQIITLDNQVSCELISNWYWNEWHIPVETSLQKLSLCQTHNVPFQILMTIDNLPIATAGLYHHVGLHDYFPKYKQYPIWLALVYTLPEYRGKGYGSMLCEKVQSIVAIKRRNYDSKTDSTLVVIPNVFNQFDKGWKMKPFRSLFGELSPQITQFIPEFEALMTHLAELSAETLDAFDKYGELRAGMLAMRHVRNKKFLIEHFEEIFVFLEQHPERVNMRNQIIAYLLSESSLKAQELEELLIDKRIIKKGNKNKFL